MTDDALPSQPPSRRERLARRSRRARVRWAVAGVTSAALAASLAVAAFAAGGDPDDVTPTTVAGPLTDDHSLSSLRRLAEDAPKRPLDHDDPLRLWIGGDSLSGALGIALGDLTSDTGVVDTEVDYKVSSGLAGDDVRDWPEHAAEALAEHDPEAVVFMIGTNDASIVSSRTEEWAPRYRERVREMMTLLVGGAEERTVIWIGAPTMADSWRDRGVVALNEIMRDEASRFDDVVYVDAYALFADDDGEYAASLRGDDGDLERVRIDDGVHFTITGGRRLASVVFDLLDARWRIRAQADPDHPIGFDIADGGEWRGGTDDDLPGVTASTATATTTTTTAPLASTTSSAPTPTTVPSASSTTVTAAATSTSAGPSTSTSAP
jgi:hypothetical protein